MITYPTKKLGKGVFNEDAVCYAFYKNYIPQNSRVFFKLAHNIAVKNPRGWDYWCAPEIDVIEITNDNRVIGYELKGARKHKNGEASWPGFYDGLGQALAYLNLPRIWQNNRFLFDGGVFDFVYLVHARSESRIEEDEIKILDLTPIGFISVAPDGIYVKLKEALTNPLKSDEAKQHFLNNLATLEKHSIKGRIFRGIEQKGKTYFQEL